MPKFIYRVRDHLGRSDSGILTAGSLAEASAALRQDGKIIVDLREDAPEPDALQLSRLAGRRVKADDVIFFATQLAVMVDTGVPLTEALASIAETSEHVSVRAVVTDICEQVKGGTEFSVALAKHPKVFGQLFVALMRASEASGTMGQMLQRLSRYLRQERDTRKKVMGAMTYPICMLVFCVAVVVGLLAFVLPRFQKIYAGKGAILPGPTRALLALSTALTQHWPWLLAGMAAVGALLFLSLRSPGGRVFLDRLRISLPVVGPMFRKAYLARSLRTMATMVSTGVGMLEGLAITAQVAGNHFFSLIWTNLAERVKRGGTVSEELFECRLVPRTVAQMVSAGERTGKLGTVMDRVAGFCEDDLAASIRVLTSLIEPIMIVIMGAIVGFIAVALLLPIFRMSSVVAR